MMIGIAQDTLKSQECKSVIIQSAFIKTSEECRFCKQNTTVPLINRSYKKEQALIIYVM